MKNWLEDIAVVPITDLNSGNTYQLSEAPIPLLKKIFDTIAWDSIERR